MNCIELINLFEKVGGILKCDYRNKKMFVANTILECNIYPEHYERIQFLLFEFGGSPYEVKHIKAKNKDEIDEYIKQKNRFLSYDEIGFTINFTNSYNKI